MTDCLIAFGANEGDPTEAFRMAESLLRETEGVSSLVSSSAHQTAPVGGPKDQPVYLNAAFRLTTLLTDIQLHRALIKIESKLGRTRKQRWGARKIDLDLLLYGDHEIEHAATSKSAELFVPHPRMSFRRFVLEPAVEIASDMLHPTSGLTIGELVEHLDLVPRTLVWITRNKKVAHVIMDSVFDSLGSKMKSRWKFSIVSPNDARSVFATLLLFDVDEFETEYCMPLLDLRRYSADRIKVELVAAVQAMN